MSQHYDKKLQACLFFYSTFSKYMHALYHKTYTSQKMKFSIKNFFSKCGSTFSEEILNGKFHFLCSVKEMCYVMLCYVILCYVMLCYAMCILF